MTDKLVVVFSGKKGSGKDTTARLLRGGPLSRLTCETLPFAGPLKRFCVDVLGLNPDHAYGSDDDKNNPSHISWADIAGGPGGPPNRGIMTVREVLQWVGTEWVRRADPNSWTRAWRKDVDRSFVDVVYCTDCRFPNEVEVAREAGAFIVRLLRAPHAGDEHESEKALDDYPLDRFSLVVDNRRQTPEQTAREVAAALRLFRPDVFS